MCIKKWQPKAQRHDILKKGCLERHIYENARRWNFIGQPGLVFSELWLSDLGVSTLYRGIWTSFWIMKYCISHLIHAKMQDPFYAYEVLHDFPSFPLLGYLQCHEHILWLHNYKPSHAHRCFLPYILSILRNSYSDSCFVTPLWIFICSCSLFWHSIN